MSTYAAGPHRYFSGVFWDTAPGDAIGCCDFGPDNPIHDVPCPECGTAHGVTYACPPADEIEEAKRADPAEG
jgi:hypothetical protein